MESKAGPEIRETVTGSKQADIFYLESVLSPNQLLVKHFEHYLKTRPPESGFKDLYRFFPLAPETWDVAGHMVRGWSAVRLPKKQRLQGLKAWTLGCFNISA